MQAPQSNTASGEETAAPSFFASIRAAAAAQQKNSDGVESASSLAANDQPQPNQYPPLASRDLSRHRTPQVEDEPFEGAVQELSASRAFSGLGLNTLPPTVLSRLISSANADRLRRKESPNNPTVQMETPRDRFGAATRAPNHQHLAEKTPRDLLAARRADFPYASFDRDDRDHGENNHSSTASGQAIPTTPVTRSNSSDIRPRQQLPNDQLTRAGLAHDAKNLLSAFHLYCDLLARPDVLPERYRHYADDLRSLTRRSWTLVEDLIVSREPTGSSTSATVGQASAVDVLTDCRSLLNTLAHGRLKITFGEYADLPLPISAESLERILINLLNNAVHATRQRGAIRIRVGTVESSSSIPTARVTTDSDMRNVIARTMPDIHGMQDPIRTMALIVDDSGCGMTEDQIQHISSQVRILPGQRHGIGMQVVRSLVEFSGGTLKIQSRIDIGTRIEIRWPVSSQSSSQQPRGEPVSGTIYRMEMVADRLVETEQRFNTRGEQFNNASSTSAPHPLQSRSVSPLSLAPALKKGAIAC